MKKLFQVAALVVSTLALSGCLSLKSYVDPALGELPAAERVQVAKAQPVQFIFEFKTKGAPNARATKLLSEQATDIVRKSGLFSEVSSEPVQNRALLSVSVDNIPQEGAASKGFATGLTLGLAGSLVDDYYEGSARYSPGANGAVISVRNKHAIHSMIGAGSAPANMVQSKNLDEAARTMLRQLMDRMLNDLAKDPGFAKASTNDPANEKIG